MNKAVPQDVQRRMRVVYQITDVIVRDRDGNFVRDLGPDDFTVKVDGTEVEVKSVDELEALAPTDERIKNYVELVAEARELGEPLPEPPVPPRFVIILFDRFNLSEQGIKEAKEAARKIVLESLLPQDQVAVFQYNKSLSVLTQPTSDRPRILRAIYQAGGISRNDYYIPRRHEFFMPKTYIESVELKQVLMEKEQDFKEYVDALRILVSSMARMAGRKTFLVFSDGPNLFNPDRPELRASRNATRRSAGFDPDREAVSIATTEDLDAPPSKIAEAEAVDVSMHFTPQFIHSEFARLSEYLASANATLYTIRRGSLMPDWTMGTDSFVEAPIPTPTDSSDIGEANLTVPGVLNDMQGQRIGVLEDFASMSNGKFFDAGVDLPKLLETLREEVGNYYVLGFEPPAGSEGKFHSLAVTTENESYRVIHRQGFFEKKRIDMMTDRERALHLEEGFMTPGVLNELNLDARGIHLPWRGKPTALVSLAFDSGILGDRRGDAKELEMVINLEDREGRIRYRAHKKFSTSAQNELPKKLRYNLLLPLLDEACAVYLAVRDNATGLRSTWREVFRPTPEGGAILVSEPMFVSSNVEGDIGRWEASDVKDGVEPVEAVSPDAYYGSEIDGQVLADNTVEQGESVDVLFFIGNISSGVDPSELDVKAEYMIDPETENSFSLQAESENFDFKSGRGLLVIKVRLPIGLAQLPSGTLVAVFQGLFQDKLFMSKVPYSIAAFSRSKALELKEDPRIKPLL